MDIPGSTLALFASRSTSITPFMYLERSRIIPSPTAWPARLVPAPRAVTDTPRARACARATATSRSVLGITTAWGSIL